MVSGGAGGGGGEPIRVPTYIWPCATIPQAPPLVVVTHMSIIPTIHSAYV